MKKLLYFSVAVMFCLSTQATAGIINWTDDLTDHDWTHGGNWSPERPYPGTIYDQLFL